MSYFPCDIPFMSEDEKKKNGIKCNSDVDKDTNVPSKDTISRQAALAETVHSEREEVTMGYLKEKHGVMMLGKTPEGTCPECAVKHDPRYPHDRNSLTYQYKFYDQHGRWPTWADAMAHCDEAMREVWTEALKERGVEV